MSKNTRVLRTAEISPRAVTYSVLATSLVFASTIFGILLLPFAVPMAWWYFRRFYASLEVVLTSRELQVARGVFIRREQSIPLEKVTDLALVQGPVMRRMEIKGLRVETAGQTGGGGALVQLVGIVDADGFRDLALDQRDKVTDEKSGAQGGGEEGPDVLVEIRDALLRIERGLGGSGERN